LVDRSDIIFVGAILDKRLCRLVKNNPKSVPIFEHLSRFRPFFPNIVVESLRRIKFYLTIQRRLSHLNKKYVLCRSSFAGSDFRFCGWSKRTTLKFSYFPILSYASDEQLKDKQDILYVGRDIGVKHPEIALFAYRLLSQRQPNKLYIVGEGLKKYVDRDDIIWNESIENRDLLKLFAKSSVFVFPSDRREGFGVVVLEALAAGCIVFANSSAGATRYLINDKKNGFSYKTKRGLKKRIAYFEKMPPEQILEMRRNAVRTVQLLWNGSVAAKRMVCFIKCFIEGSEFVPYAEGPFSLDKG